MSLHVEVTSNPENQRERRAMSGLPAFWSSFNSADISTWHNPGSFFLSLFCDDKTNHASFTICILPCSNREHLRLQSGNPAVAVFVSLRHKTTWSFAHSLDALDQVKTNMQTFPVSFSFTYFLWCAPFHLMHSSFAFISICFFFILVVDLILVRHSRIRPFPVAVSKWATVKRNHFKATSFTASFHLLSVAFSVHHHSRPLPSRAALARFSSSVRPTSVHSLNLVALTLFVCVLHPPLSLTQNDLCSSASSSSSFSRLVLPRLVRRFVVLRCSSFPDSSSLPFFTVSTFFHQLTTKTLSALFLLHRSSRLRLFSFALQSFVHFRSTL